MIIQRQWVGWCGGGGCPLGLNPLVKSEKDKKNTTGEGRDRAENCIKTPAPISGAGIKFLIPQSASLTDHKNWG